jgi:hypothetical protein
MGLRYRFALPVFHRPVVPAFLPALLLAACAQSPPAPTSAAAVAAVRNDAAPGPVYSLFHRALPAPEGKAEVLRLHGQGAQIFRCEAQPTGRHWVYRLPEADLADNAGTVFARHGANLSFEHVDGSRLLGEIADHVPSPVDNALPWLLINTRAYGKGALAGITQVQRIDTVGGMPPAGCDGAQLGQVLRVPFSADFVFFR